MENERIGNTTNNDNIAAAESIDDSFIEIGNGASRGAVLGAIETSGQDWYSLTLTAGQAATLAIVDDSPFQDSSITIKLFDADGTLLAVGMDDAQNVNRYIADFVPTITGTYYARVSAVSAGSYNLVVTRGVSFNLEIGSVNAPSQDISFTDTVLGYVGNGSGIIGWGATGTTSLGVKLTDSTGYQWEIARDGSIYRINNAYAWGMHHSGFYSFNSAMTQEDGREVIIGPAFVNGVEVIRKIYVPTDQSFARFLEIIHNPGVSAVNYTVPIYTELGSYGNEQFVQTSSGDDITTTDDDWLITNDSLIGASPSDPVVTHVVAGQGGSLRPSTFIKKSSSVNYSYNLTLAPGETKIVMHFASLAPDHETALARAPQLAKLELDALKGMSADELASVVNFPVSNAPDHFLISVNEGDTLLITTKTPGDGPNEPVNLLDPLLVLYGQDGVELFRNDNGSGDGRNGRIEYTVPTGGAGKYRLEVLAVNDSSGSYVLTVDGATGEVHPSPPKVVGTDPLNGRHIIKPAGILMQLSEGIRADSVTADDLTIDGAATVTGVELQTGNRIFFQLDFPNGDRTYNYSIADGAFNDYSGPHK